MIERALFGLILWSTLASAQTPPSVTCDGFRGAARLAAYIASTCRAQSQPRAPYLTCSLIPGAVAMSAILAYFAYHQPWAGALRESLTQAAERETAELQRLLVERARVAQTAAYRGAAGRTAVPALEESIAVSRARLDWIANTFYEKLGESLVGARRVLAGATSSVRLSEAAEQAAVSPLRREVFQAALRASPWAERLSSGAVMGILGAEGGAVLGMLAGAGGYLGTELVLQAVFPEHAGDPTESQVGAIVEHPETLFAIGAEAACRYIEAYGPVRRALAPVLAQIRATADSIRHGDAGMAVAADAAGIPREMVDVLGPSLGDSQATRAIARTWTGVPAN